MRLIVGAAFAALMFAGAAAAQDATTPPPAAPPAETACGPIQAAPTLPDGAAANVQQMTTGNTAFTAWIESTNEPLRCRREEAQAAIARADSLRQQFNTAAEGVAGVRTSWAAEVGEFNTAHPSRGGGR